MPVDPYQPPQGFMMLTEARRRLGVSHTKMWSLAKEGAIRVYDDPRDRRVRLVRVDDVEALAQPRPRDGGDSSGTQRGV